MANWEAENSDPTGGDARSFPRSGHYAKDLATERQKLECIIAQAPLGMALMRGPNFVFEKVNAKWRELVSDREYLGKTHREAYPELADTPLESYLTQVFETGVPFEAHELKVIVETNQGGIEERFYDFSYLRISDGEGKPYGVVCHSLDVTKRVLDRRRIEQNEARLASERHNLEMMFQDSPAAMAIWRGPDLIFEKVNPRYQAIFEDRPLVGKGFLEALPEFVGQPFADLIAKVLETGVPFTAQEALARVSPRAGAPLEDRYYDFTYLRVNDSQGKPYGVYDHAVDVTDRVLARKKLEESEARFKQLADSMPQIVWTANPDGKIDYFNRRWYRFTGRELGDGGRESWGPTLDPREIGATEEAWMRSVRTGEPFEWEHRLLEGATGQLRWHLSRGVAIRNPEGEIVKWFGTSTDIHDVKRIQEELTRSNQELARFAFVASHDLKEPIRTVSNYSQLLQMRYRGRLDESADLYIDFITQGVSRMYELIDDLLSYSRIGATELELHSVSMQNIVGVVIENLGSSVRESGAKISHGPLPTITADPGQLSQLLQNLIGNAIKYRSDRTPEISLHATEQEKDWKFEMRDNGIGISPLYHEKIFVLFQRLHSKDQYSGTGIGLAVCKKIIERHGGKIWVESQSGQGSRFFFTLPKREADAPKPEPESPPAPARAAAGRAIGN